MIPCRWQKLALRGSNPRPLVQKKVKPDIYATASIFHACQYTYNLYSCARKHTISDDARLCSAQSSHHTATNHKESAGSRTRITHTVRRGGRAVGPQTRVEDVRATSSTPHVISHPPCGPRDITLKNPKYPPNNPP